RLLPKWPDWTSMALAVVGILALFGFVFYEVVANIGVMVMQRDQYLTNFNILIDQVYGLLGMKSPPTLDVLLKQVDLGSIARGAVGEVQQFAGNTLFVLIYLGFMFPAAARIHQKLDRIFPDDDERGHVRDVLTAIRRSMAQYLWVQTVLSAIATV